MENTENKTELWGANITPQEQHPEKDKEKKNESNSGEGTETSNKYDQPNKIEVEISSKSPIVIFFGEKSCGKTMSLVRLTKWLRKGHYTVEPVRQFRPADDKEYEKVCENFDKVVDSKKQAPRTEQLDFLLLRVAEAGRDVCQILEAPGEHYTKEDLPMYLETIKSLEEHKKIWMFFVEIDSSSNRDAYVNRIRALSGMIRWKNSKDSVVFVCHKVDKKEKDSSFYHDARPIDSYFKQKINEQYDGLFKLFQRQGLCGIKEKYRFITFSSGKFMNVEGENECTYKKSEDFFPEKMWSTIDKCIKGEWF